MAVVTQNLAIRQRVRAADGLRHPVVELDGSHRQRRSAAITGMVRAFALALTAPASICECLALRLIGKSHGNILVESP